MKIVTFTTDFQIIVSRRCAYACGYCNFPNTMSPTPPSPKALRKMLSTAARLGAVQITLTAGEGVESLEEIVSTARYYGFESWAEYLHALCAEVLDWKGPGVFFPRLDAGALDVSNLRRLAPVIPLARIMVYSADDDVSRTEVHKNAVHKNPATRFAAVEDFGRARIPVVTGITVGLGESAESWVYAAHTISAIHARFHHVHSFVLRPFDPVPGSPMGRMSAVPDDVFIQAVRAVRGALDKKILLSAEIGSRINLGIEAVSAGANDLGSLNAGSSDRLNFDLAATIDSLRRELGERDTMLCFRSPINETFHRKDNMPSPVVKAIARYHQIADRMPYSDALTHSDCYQEQTAS